jgi:hypothetical protein
LAAFILDFNFSAEEKWMAVDRGLAGHAQPERRVLRWSDLEAGIPKFARDLVAIGQYGIDPQIERRSREHCASQGKRLVRRPLGKESFI